MARGRPPLRIGQHGKINRKQVAPGVWEARCRFRCLDGVVRPVQRQTPLGVSDRHGAAAEAALVAHLAELSGASDDGEVTPKTLVSVLLQRHMDALEEAEKAPRTLYSYGLRVGYWNDVAAGITVADCTPGRLDRLLGQVRAGHGETDAKQLRTLVAAALDYAVREGVLQHNPARAAKSPPKKKSAKNGGAHPLDRTALPAVLKALMESDACRAKDLTDPILLHLATGLRVSEVLGLLWSEVNLEAEKPVVAVTGRVVWAKGQGLLRTPTADSSKGTPSFAVLPPFAVGALRARATEPRPNKLGLVFPSTVGTLRDPTNFARQWRSVRDDLEHLAGTTGHSFRKTLSDLATDTTKDPRVAADVLGHADMSTTLKHYLSRGKLHPEVADAIEAATRPALHAINGE